MLSIPVLVIIYIYTIFYTIFSSYINYGKIRILIKEKNLIYNLPNALFFLLIKLRKLKEL